MTKTTLSLSEKDYVIGGKASVFAFGHLISASLFLAGIWKVWLAFIIDLQYTILVLCAPSLSYFVSLKKAEIHVTKIKMTYQRLRISWKSSLLQPLLFFF